MKKLLGFLCMLIIACFIIIACDDTQKKIIAFPGIKGDKGDTGEQGPQGIPGTQGVDGAGCFITNVVENDVMIGYQLTCGNSAPVLVRNGQDGQPGAQGQIGPSNIQVIYPCGYMANVYNEILLRLPGDVLVCYFKTSETSETEFLTVLIPGNYVTTDSKKCFFSVDSSMNIVNQHQ